MQGIAIVVFFLTGLMTVAFALLFQWAYVRAAEAEKRRPVELIPPSAHTNSPHTLVTSSMPVAELEALLRRAPLWSGGLHVMVAAVIAIYMTGLLVTSDRLRPDPEVVLFAVMTLLWGAALVAAVTTGGTGRRERILVSALASLSITGILGMFATAQVGDKSSATLWVFSTVVPTFALVVVLLPSIRAVGPLVLLAALPSVIAVVGVLPALRRWAPNATIALLWTVFVNLGVGATVVLLAIFILGSVLGAALGFRLAFKMVHAYVRNRLGDEGIVVAAVWAIYVAAFVLFHLTEVSSAVLVLGWAAIPAYGVLIGLARRVTGSMSPAPGPLLLLLRVFEKKGPTPTLFHTLSRHWRRVGPMAMISGWDLAALAIEPTEMRLFLRGEIRKVFVRGVESALEEVAPMPFVCDADGRFRCRQLFCGDDVWFEVVRGLIKTSAVILIDVRRLQYEPHRTRSIYRELEACRDSRALGRTVILHGGSDSELTPLPALRSEYSAAALLEIRDDGPESVKKILGTLAERCLNSARVTPSVGN